MISDGERKTLIKAQGILGTLTPATAPNADTVSALRRASRLVTGAMNPAMSSDAVLVDARNAAINALNVVAGTLDARTLTQDLINEAKRAVAALLDM